MSKNERITYTAYARRFALKYPFFTAVSISINFWTIAYILLITILYLGFNAVLSTIPDPPKLHFGPPLFLGIFIGISYGFIIGSINFFFDKKVKKNLPLWKLILYQSVLSLVVLLTLVFFSRTVLFETLVRLFSINDMLGERTEGLNLTFAIIIYTFMMSLLINFINQMNKKFGPGILLPMMLGRFRNPREEERVFMFLDLKDSTSYAEQLGHLKYSAFVRDCFQDVNEVVKKYYAEIYQYVGDEMVLSWETPFAFDENRILRFYFSCKDYFIERNEYYKLKYGIKPHFKAGLHMGLVTVVEVGDLKRDIAYHGDTLNVTARIENLCKQKDQDLLISETVYSNISSKSEFDFTSLGDQQLKGRTEMLEVFSVTQKPL